MGEDKEEEDEKGQVEAMDGRKEGTKEGRKKGIKKRRN